MTDYINDSSLWRAFEDSELTHSAAHYLTTIKQLRQQYGYARVTDVADTLKVSRGAASRAMVLLKERGWIQEDLHRMLQLTDKGMERARNVERNFLVVERFLQDVLGLPHDVAHEDACKMEHLLSSDTTLALIRFVRLLGENRTMLKKLKTLLEEYQPDCRDKGRCLICEHSDACLGVDDQCLLQPCKKKAE